MDTDSLVESLVTLASDVTVQDDDVELAGYSEACISVLLRHLDTAQVSKSSLEDLVTTQLLVDVTHVARAAAGDVALRAAGHKLQVLLRAEVHWLLASQVI